MVVMPLFQVSACSEVMPTPDNTKHLLRVVDDREAERCKARSRYLGLMRTHIEQQLQQYMERENLLKKRMERREKKAKVISSTKRVGVSPCVSIYVGVLHFKRALPTSFYQLLVSLSFYR